MANHSTLRCLHDAVMWSAATQPVLPAFFTWLTSGEFECSSLQCIMASIGGGSTTSPGLQDEEFIESKADASVTETACHSGKAELHAESKTGSQPHIGLGIDSISTLMFHHPTHQVWPPCWAVTVVHQCNVSAQFHIRLVSRGIAYLPAQPLYYVHMLDVCAYRCWSG